MAKSKNIFFCQECGYESAKWLGQCPACKAWNAFVEEPTIGKGSAASGVRHQAEKFGTLGYIAVQAACNHHNTS